MKYILENEYLLLEISTHGAELVRIFDKKKNRDVLWCGDSTYWNRQSPILFPNVGKYNDGKFIYNNQVYYQKQHGFARDKEFTLNEQNANSIYFDLSYDDETLKVYPFKFLLTLGYKLIKNKIEVIYQVKNLGENLMYFQIGGHPAFCCPLNKNNRRSDYYIHIPNKDKIISSQVNSEGLACDIKKEYILDDGYLRIEDDLFDNDAVILEKQEIKQISICDESKNPYITFDFDVDIFGIWSITSDAPFVSIEPWYGRCDRFDFNSDISNREYINKLESNKDFIKSYFITID